ncbi:MAG: WD40 repeat domain-containing protein [Anaerolineales bacterium]|nr:WD40 repeat domain-containing protein [Anaerolineales bacterium]
MTVYERDYTIKNTSISRDNISFIEEVFVMSACKESDKITSFVLKPDRAEIVVYCMGNSEILVLDISTSEVLESYKLNILSQGVEISNNGNVVVGATKSKDSTTIDPDLIGDFIGGVYVWIIDDINRPVCVDWCESGDEEFYGFSRGITISKDGKQVIEYDSSSFILLDLENKTREYVLLSQDADFHVSIGEITFHPNGKKYAVSFLENDGFIKGNVQISRFSGPLSNFPDVVNKNQKADPVYVKALEFTPDGKWLANITDQGVNIWRVLWGKPRTLSTIQNPQNIVFDVNSNMLFIQAENSIIVYDLKRDELISELDTPGITSITISFGNEYLAWGDEEGKIHLWGIK